MWPKLPKNPLIATSLGIRINDTDFLFVYKTLSRFKKIKVSVTTNRSQKHIMQSNINLPSVLHLEYYNTSILHKYIAYSLDFEAKPLSTNNNNFVHQIEREYDSSHN
jgi:hypothetical protein